MRTKSFNTPDVQATLTGRKTMFREVIKPQHIKDKMKANQDAYRPKPNTNYAVQLFRVSNQEWVDLCYCGSVGKAIVTAEKEGKNWNAPSRAISKRTNTILAEFNNKEGKQ